MGRTATSDQSLSQLRGDRLGLRMDLQLLVNVFEPTFPALERCAPPCTICCDLRAATWTRQAHAFNA